MAQAISSQRLYSATASGSFNLETDSLGFTLLHRAPSFLTRHL